MARLLRQPFEVGTAPLRGGSFVSLGRDVLEGLGSRRAACALAVFGVAVSALVSAVLVVVVASLDAVGERLVGELGADVVVAIPEPATGGLGVGADIVGLLRANLDGAVVSAVRRSEARTLGSRSRLKVVSTDPWLAGLRGWHLAAGRFLDAEDLAGARRHVVVSEALATRWNWRVGHVVLVGDTPFAIVGIVSPLGEALAGHLGDPRLALGEQLVFVPATVPPVWSDEGDATAIEALFLSRPGADPEEVRASAENLLRPHAGDEDTIAWVTPRSLTRRIGRLQELLGGSLALLSLLCVTLAGTTLMSLMVASVRERVAEIGLRRSLGATRFEVAQLFIVEAATITIAGSVAGTAAAQLLLVSLSRLSPVPVLLDWRSWILPIALCLGSGVAFSSGAAIRAAHIRPARALRED